MLQRAARPVLDLLPAGLEAERPPVADLLRPNRADRERPPAPEDGDGDRRALRRADGLGDMVEVRCRPAVDGDDLVARMEANVGRRRIGPDVPNGAVRI